MDAKYFSHCTVLAQTIDSNPVLSPASNVLCLRVAALTLLCAALAGCRNTPFPSYPAAYREYAYVADGGSNTVTVLDLVDLRLQSTLTVGHNPTGLAVNPKRPEIYAVNSASGTVSVINTVLNRVEATIGVQRRPYFITVAPDGKRAYVPNSASNTVSVIDLDTRRQIAAVGTGEGPGIARVAPDNRSLIVTNRVAGSVSVYTINADDNLHPLTFRESFDDCPGATDAVIEADSKDFPTFGSKAFIACSAGHQVLDVWLGAAPNSFRAKENPSLAQDAKLALLDVGEAPVHLVLKADDNGEVYSTNFLSGTVSAISTWTNEVEGTYRIGTNPSHAIISDDGDLLWVTNFGEDSATLYSIADGRIVTGVHTGSRPDALAFSKHEHILLVADVGSSDIAVIRTQDTLPTLMTMLPAGPQPNDIVVWSNGKDEGLR